MMRLTPVKIIFYDIDGTLIDPSTKCISEKTIDTIKVLHQKGILQCIVTGRPRASLPDFGDLHFDAMVTFNGAFCYTDSEVIYSNPIDPADVEIILQNAAALGRPVSIAVKDRLAANGIDPDLADYYRLSKLELTVAEDFLPTCQEDIYQIMLGCRETDHAAITQGTSNVKLAISWDRAVDVIPKNGGKGHAVHQILSHFRLDPSEALAFGDGLNDIEMLQAVGTGVAMGNAAAPLKEIADAICDPVSEEGIYLYCLSQGLI
jgi:Cof subfamily protein (haloacid dehalogenase superfamily)